MNDTSARLIAVSYVGELGVARRTETTTDILCQLGSVNRTEFYAAYNSGFRPEYRVTTAPVNYAGQTLIELDTPDGPVLCDIYRTYRKSLDVLELWCCLHNSDAVQVFTLFTAGKKVSEKLRTPADHARILEQLRGADSSYTVAQLSERGLIAPCGRLEAPGRPMLFGTTEQFLRVMGISSLEELPPLPNVASGEGIDELQEAIDAAAQKEQQMTMEGL